MSENNDIDKLFQQGLNANYPYDTSLWGKVENKLISKNKSSAWYFNLNSISLFIVLLSCALFKSDNSKSSILPDSNFSNLHADRSNTSQSTNNKQSPSSNPVQSNQFLATESLNNVPKQSKESIANVGFSNESISNNSKNIFEEKTQAAGFKKMKKNQAAKKQENDIISSEQLTEHQAFKLTKMTLKEFDTGLSLFEKNPFKSTRLDQLQSSVKPTFYYLELELSRSISLNKKVNSNKQAFIDYKELSENPTYRESIGINLLTDYKFLTVGIGVHYSQYFEQINYQYNNETIIYETSFDTTYRLVNGSFNSNGHSVLLVEENINETNDERIIEENKELLLRNEFKRIQIPIIVGYHRSFGRWLTGFQLAFVTNYINDNSGLYVNQELNGFNDLNEKSQLKEFMFSQKNQVNLGFALNEFILLGGRFSYEYDLNSFTKEYESNFQSYNLGIWLQWRP